MDKALTGDVKYTQNWVTSDVSYIELSIAGNTRAKLIIPENHKIKLTIEPIPDGE